jgi:hypothetical protein
MRSCRGAVCVGLLCLAVAFTWFYWKAICTTRQERKESVFILCIATLVMLLALGAVELVLTGRAVEYSKSQLALQAQLLRSNGHKETWFRGECHVAKFNELGFADHPRTYSPGANQVVFIGDSFLEVRSATNLAAICERQLQTRWPAVAVLNLAKADTGLDEYRFRFEEVALPLKPAHVLLFLSEVNDFDLNYGFVNYTSPPVRVTSTALRCVRRLALDSSLEQALEDLRGNPRSFTGRTEFLEALRAQKGGITLPPPLPLLAYLICHAYSGNVPPATNRALFPRSLSALGSWTMWRTARANTREDARVEWWELQSEYDRIFQHPETERLPLIGTLLDERVFKRDGAGSCMPVLRALSGEFQSELVEEADMTYYLLPAVKAAVRHVPPQLPRPSFTNILARGTSSLAMVLEAMHARARDEGIKFSVVLIPEASYGDDAFRAFWLPLVDFRQVFQKQHMVYGALKERLSRTMDVIDLRDTADELREGYWLFDGHWNRRGNESVARTLVAYLDTQLSVDGQPQRVEGLVPGRDNTCAPNLESGVEVRLGLGTALHLPSSSIP